MAKKQKKRKKKKLGGIFILLLLFVIALVMLLTSPVFCVKSVEVLGNSRLTAEEIYAAADIPEGINSFRLSLRGTKKRVESLPYIMTAKVSRRLPDKIRIHVTERTEKAMAKTAAGYAVIDNTGSVLRLVDKEEGLPILSGFQTEQAVEGSPIQLSEGKPIEEYLAIMNVLEKEALLEPIKEISILSNIDVRLYLKSGMEIYLGATEDMEYKLKLVRNILTSEGTNVTAESNGVLRWTNEGQFSYRQSTEP